LDCGQGRANPGPFWQGFTDRAGRRAPARTVAILPRCGARSFTPALVDETWPARSSGPPWTGSWPHNRRLICPFIQHADDSAFRAIRTSSDATWRAGLALPV